MIVFNYYIFRIKLYDTVLIGDCGTLDGASTEPVAVYRPAHLLTQVKWTSRSSFQLELTHSAAGLAHRHSSLHLSSHSTVCLFVSCGACVVLSALFRFTGTIYRLIRIAV